MVFKKVLLSLPELKSKESTKSKPSKKKKLEAKLQGIAQKRVDIAKSRFISVQEILLFDLVTSVLFEGDLTLS